MSVLISGVLMNPAGVPVVGAEVTFSALTNGPSVLNGFSASVMTDQDGNYSIPLEICEYAISIQSDGYNSVYGSVSINEKSTPATINELLKLAAMEQAVTPAIIVYFREIQADVAAKLATMQTLSNNATTAARDATTARNEAAQYAQNLSTVLAQAQQASTSATASANMATQSANKADSAKNAAEAAARNAQATLTDVMKKSANGADIADAAQFRNNVGLKNAATHDVQTSATDATAGLVLKIADNGEGSFGLGGNAIAIPAGSTIPAYFNNLPTGFYRAGSNIAGTFSPICDYSWIRHDANNGVLIAVGIGAIGAMAFRLLSAGSWSGWRTVWHDGNITLAGMYADRGSLGTTDLNTLIGLDHRGTWTQGTTANAIAARNYPIVSAGSLEVTYNNANGIGTLQKYTTHASNRVFIRSNYVGADASNWSPWVEAWTTANLPNPTTLDTTQTITGTKVFKTGQQPLRLLADVAGAPIFIPFFDSNGTTRKGWFGRGSANDTIQIQNDVTGAGVTLSQDGNINLSSPNGVVNWNGQQVLMSGNAQTITGAKMFTQSVAIRPSGAASIGIELGSVTNAVPTFIDLHSGGQNIDYDARIISTGGGTGIGGATLNLVATVLQHSGSVILANGKNAVADSSGFWKTASPVINIYADGSFTTTDEAAGVNVERLSEGVYKITGCQGMHPDAAWNGIDGGVSNPKCRNDKALLWNNYEVDEDGSVTVYTFHRVHPDAMPFAQNRLTLDKEPFDPKKGHKLEDTWPDQTPIDVPRGLFIQVRVNMPEREEPNPVISHSNVYCTTISPA